MKLPFGNEAFDIITAFETIYFWPNINEAFKQVYRVLKGSGTFMICNESNGKNSPIIFPLVMLYPPTRIISLLLIVT